MDRAVPVIPVDDPDAAKQFYVDALGFRVTSEGRYPHEPQDGTIIGLDRGTIHITLDCPMPGHGREICVTFEVSDADALYDAWRSKAQIDAPPENQPWGARTFVVTDPFGNTLFVLEPIADGD